MSDQNVLGQPVDLTTPDGYRYPMQAILSWREEYVRGEIDESDELAPARGIMLGAALSVAAWIGIAVLVKLYLMP